MYKNLTPRKCAHREKRPQRQTEQSLFFCPALVTHLESSARSLLDGASDLRAKKTEPILLMMMTMTTIEEEEEED